MTLMEDSQTRSEPQGIFLKQILFDKVLLSMDGSIGRLFFLVTGYIGDIPVSCKLFFIFFQQFSESWPYIDVTEIEPP